MMANLVADSGCNKGQFSSVVEAICRKFRSHDDEELQKLVCWQKQVKTKAAPNDPFASPKRFVQLIVSKSGKISL